MPTPLITPTTELEAVNAILASIGESPVDSLDDSFVDSLMAQNILSEESKRVQTQGWEFNTELKFVLTPDTTGQIWLPVNTLKFINENHDYVQRGVQLYDRRKHALNQFTTSITCDLILGLDFDVLPEALRLFLTIRAGRRFQDRAQGDTSLHQFQAQDEMAAWTAFQNDEADVADYNVNKTSRLVGRIKRYRHY